MNLLNEAMAIKEETIRMRRDFHQHPELGLIEIRTAQIIADTLIELGLEVKTGIGKTGVVGLLRGKVDSPVILLRFDIDALPIQEETNVVFSSQNPGIMHACGHDSHIAVGLSVAKLLASHRAELQGSVKFVFQPGEEGAGGAALMVKDGVLKNPKPDYALAMHNWDAQPVGSYAVGSGPIMASAHVFSVKVIGSGGHGASPHMCIDPILCVTQIINALQTITSRNISPLQSAVLSVCMVTAGTAHNIIPQEASFSGTIRTFNPEVLNIILKRFHEIINHIAEAMSCRVDISVERLTYPVINDPNLAELLISVIKEVDPNAKIDSIYQSTGAEDFPFLMQNIPGCYVMVGSAHRENRLIFKHHHSKFDLDESSLPYAVAMMAQGAMTILEKNPKAV